MRKAYSYIRMSTDIQEKGDSMRRQLEGSQRYAVEQSLELVEFIDGVPFKDIGVSGFKGANTKKGVLARFLEALEAEKIEKGSVLIVESLDRLSRDSVLEAFSQFTGILKAGIEIVTLADRQCYTYERVSKDASQLFISLGVMVRAHEESLIKSQRISASWREKRKNASKIPMTKWAPAWLKLDESKQKFVAIPARAAVVKKIFRWSIESCGIFVIAKQLNASQTPPFTARAKQWYPSYVVKILTNRAVLGEFQPHSKLDGTRKPDGDPIKGYFPQIIDENTFHLANAAMKGRITYSKGRKGSSFTNIFSGIIYCGNCGTKMASRNRGGGPKGGTYLCCASRKSAGTSCEMPEWDLKSVENAIFTHLQEVDYTTLLNSEPSKSLAIEERITIHKEKLQEEEDAINALLNNLIQAELNEQAKQRVNARLNSLSDSIQAMKGTLSDAEQELSAVLETTKVYDSETLKSLKDMLAKHSDDYMFRSSVNQLLLKTIDKIEVFAPRTEFNPWEIDPDQKMVRDFRKLFPKYQKASFNALLKKSEFERYVKMQDNKITIRFRAGGIRHVLTGQNISFMNKKIKDH